MFDQTPQLYDAFYYAKGKDYAAEAHWIIDHIGDVCPNATSLLDVACGTGRHVEHFMQALNCTGVDISGQLLDIARQRCPTVRFVQADMTDFDLDERFDVVTCLFSSIGYARTVERLQATVAAMARHVADRGVLVVEPSFAPDQWHPGRVHALFVDQPDLKAPRMGVSGRDGDVGILDFHYLVGTGGTVEYHHERHEFGLFTRDQYDQAFTTAGLELHIDAHGPTGRGLLTGIRQQV